VREQRFVQHVEELRTTVGHVQHGLLAVRRELERLTSTGGDVPPQDRTAAASTARIDEAVDAYTYVGFENLFRGAQEEIRERLLDYVPLFKGASNVLDIGCGRGEFLDLLKEGGIGGRGLDINIEMVEECRSRRLEATVGDALGHLEGLEDESLGGLFAAQVVEHLQPDYLVRLLNIAGRKLRPGSKIVLETINPGCWFAFFDGYIRDITHVRPLHPDTLKYLLAAAGFQRTSVRYSAPYPEHAKLQHVATPAGGNDSDAAARLTTAIDVVNENANKLNSLLFTHMDYAAIGERV
jgi:O-antigen chain-terminating methyltransferase